MPSSKFSSPKQFYKRPVICKKAPPPFDPAWNSFYPPALTVNFRVADFDPPIDYNFFGSFQMTRPADAHVYNGQSTDPTHYVVGYAWPIGDQGRWHFAFTIYAPHVPGELITYQPLILPALHKLDSKNIGDVNVPLLDFRYFRIHA